MINQVLKEAKTGPYKDTIVVFEDGKELVKFMLYAVDAWGAEYYRCGAKLWWRDSDNVLRGALASDPGRFLGFAAAPFFFYGDAFSVASIQYVVRAKELTERAKTRLSMGRG